MVKLFASHRPKAARGRPPRPADRGAATQPAQPPQTAAPKGGSRLAPPRERPTAKEIGGPSGPEPTRYGDWERKGICVDF